MRLGRVEATWGFFLLLAWLNYWDRQAVVPLALAACALHELGHCAAIWLTGSNIKYIRLTVFGAEIRLCQPLGYWQEGAAALAGPGVNLLLALLFSAWEGGALFSGLNLALGCFNLLPAGQLDGGRALFCTLALLTGPDTAERIRIWSSLALAAPLLAGGLLLAVRAGNPTLLLAALWLAAMVNISIKKGRNGACHTGKKQVK